MSLVAFACDDPDVQPQLPQVFLSNRKMLTKDQVLQISSQCPTNVFVVQRASAWLNAKVLVEIISFWLKASTVRRIGATSYYQWTLAEST